MSFFGFDTDGPPRNKHDEDLAVYTWGEDSYDGLGDALDELGDDMNDETFGGDGQVGKDFDFSATNNLTASNASPFTMGFGSDHRSTEPILQEPVQKTQQQPPQPPQSVWGGAPASRTLQERWDSIPHSANEHPAHSRFAPFDEPVARKAPAQTQSQPRVRTLQEIEAELRAQAGQTPRAAPASVAPPAFGRQVSMGNQMLQDHHVQLGNNAMNGLLASLNQQEQVPIRQPQQPTPQYPISIDQLGIQPSFPPQQQPEDMNLVENLHALNIGRDSPRFHHPQAKRHVQQASLDAYAARQAEFGSPNHHFQQQAQPIVDSRPQHQRSQPSMGSYERLLLEAQIPHQTQLDPEQRNAVMGEAMRKIMQAELMEEKRRRRALKMARIAKYNDLMTQSDKDFITRIQVSQLVTQDPYTEDFYAQVFGAIVRSRLGVSGGPEKSVLKIAGGGVGLGLPGQRGAGRREQAMQRMQAQVERIVNNAQAREKDKDHSPVGSSLQGVLGKVAGRSYKAAPRQLLQVNSSTSIPKSDIDHDGVSKNAARLGREAIGHTAATDNGNVARQPALSHRQVQVAIERLYDTVLELEQMRRDTPQEDNLADREAWEAAYDRLTEELWSRTMVMMPVETSDPHPFISILQPLKGKRLLPRLIRHLPEGKVSLLMALLVACFYQLDVVRDAHILDELTGLGSPRWAEVTIQTDTFLSILPSITAVLGQTPLRLLTGFLNILLGTGKDAVLQIAKSQPGIALLTAFMGRADQLKHEDENDSVEDWQKWNTAFDNLLTILEGNIILLFPSRRVLSITPPGYPIPPLDLADQIVWQLLAVLAALGSPQQQMNVVAQVRDLILEVVQNVHGGWIADKNEAAMKLANVNILLRAIGLDDTQLLAA